LDRLRRCIWVVDVEIGVDAVADLYTQLSHAFAVRRGSPAIEARSNRTIRYSSASLASSLRAWASCALMSAPVGVKEQGRWSCCQARGGP
jgi:hypothetical protein